MEEYIKRGNYGEHQVSLILSRLNRHWYRVFNNVTIRNEVTGRLSQIDHVVVSIYGLFAIETKNYTGLVIGNEYDKSWLRLADSGEQEIYSPTVQNWGHIQALKSILWEGVEVTSIVCFMDTADLLVDARVHQVVKASNLQEFFVRYKHMIYLLGQVDNMVDNIKCSMVSGYEAGIEHGRRIRDASDASREIQYRMAKCCPKCGRLAVRRFKEDSARFCRDFPKCSHTVS